MENNQQNLTSNNEGVNTEPKAGKWVPVDINSVGFAVDGDLNKPFRGPDGEMYIIRSGKDSFEGIHSNMNNAVPTPSSIVQMPPIVQPIALVPYASQNQPLLQYDPYSRPPEIMNTNYKAEPTYIKKAYRGVSLTLAIISLLSIISILFLSIVSAQKFKSSGMDMLKAVLNLCGVECSSSYYTFKIEPFVGDMSAAFKADAFSTFMTIALPVLVILTVVITLILLAKYLLKFNKKRTPRCFSTGAFVNLCLSISIIAIIFGMSRGVDNASSLENFILGKTLFNCGLAAMLNLIISLAMLIIPFFAKKNAYVLDIPEAKRVYIINQ